MSLFSRQDELQPISGASYIRKLHKYLLTNLPRLTPPRSASSSSWLQQSYTLLTLGLDPNSAPLSPAIKMPLTLGLGQASSSKVHAKPVQLRLPPDRLLYLLLRWQSLPQSLPHVGRTDVPVEPDISVAARSGRTFSNTVEGDVQSVRSWVGTMRSVSMGTLKGAKALGTGWLGGKEDLDESRLIHNAGGVAGLHAQTRFFWPCIECSPSCQRYSYIRRTFPTHR